MDVLVDTDVIMRIVDKSSPRHRVAMKAARDLGARFRLVIVPQSACEFWAVATRTVAANGLGMNIEQADRSSQEVVDAFPLLRDERGIIQIWWDLVRRCSITGVKANDARIVAAMQRHRIQNLLTFNARDLAGYAGIQVLVPELIESMT